MKFKSFLIKYAEIGVKGKNRFLFEDALIRQIHLSLKPLNSTCHVYKEVGRIYVDICDYDYEEVIEALQHVFGIVGICPVVQIEDNGFEDLKQTIVKYMDEMYKEKKITFKVNARRARKNYPLKSMEINAAIGEALLKAFPEIRVDVHNPQVMLNIEIRKRINIYSETIPGPGGMPVGTAGKGMLLLSGGIDSPVAGYMMAKRGVNLEAVYFHTPPYTSDRAKQKVMDLAKKVAAYSGPIKLNIVNFTDIQMYIYEQCPHEELTIIMKRYFYKIAERLAEAHGCLALITGESVGQVSSQTMQSLGVINSVCEKLPVFRPLIAFDKQDIVDISEKIDTYEISIEPYEDCCTTFVADHPVTKPNLKIIKKSETRLQEKIDELVETALQNVEEVIITSE